MKTAICIKVEIVSKDGKRWKTVRFDDGSKYNVFNYGPVGKFYFEEGKRYEFEEVQNGTFTNIGSIREAGSGAVAVAQHEPPYREVSQGEAKGEAAEPEDGLGIDSANPTDRAVAFGLAVNLVGQMVACRAVEYNPTQSVSGARLKEEIRKWANFFYCDQ